MRRKIYASIVTPFLVPPTPPAAWTPASLGAALIDYWDADAGVVLSGADVITWTGQGPNAYVLGLNDIDSSDPPLSPQWGAASFNGKAGLTFSGTGLSNPTYLATVASAIAFGSNASSFFMAGTFDNTGDASARWLSFSDDAADFGAATAVAAISRVGPLYRWEQNFATGSQYAISFSTPSRFGITFDNVNGISYLDNVAKTTTGVSFTLAATGRLVVGNGWGTGQNANGVIRRFVITKSALTVGDRADVDTWLQG